jgi:hypothetical protein
LVENYRDIVSNTLYGSILLYDNVFLRYNSSNLDKRRYIFKFHVAGKLLWFRFIIEVALPTSMTTVPSEQGKTTYAIIFSIAV